jgi:hypothetical protein
MADDQSDRELTNYTRALAHMIYDADTAYEIWQAIRENGDALNQRNLGTLFGHLQSVLAAQFCLSLTKLIERPSKTPRYPIRSLYGPHWTCWKRDRSPSYPSAKRARR